jgi:hypothetical protein
MASAFPGRPEAAMVVWLSDLRSFLPEQKKSDDDINRRSSPWIHGEYWSFILN